MEYLVQRFGVRKMCDIYRIYRMLRILNVFYIHFICSPRLHLFDEKYSKTVIL